MSQYIEKIYSKINPELLLHQVIRHDVFKDAQFRIDAADTKEWLQLAALNLKKNQTFKAHKHIPKIINREMTPQECWIVLSGKVQSFYWDTDNQYLETKLLEPGDVTMTFYGGHNYESLEDNTFVYEIKVPYYEGQAKDKVFI